MHYKINKKVLIKSENAAKPDKQPSKYLEALISALPHAQASFDYGCGKLRYAKQILKTTDTLALIDSEVQISRPQVIFGKLSSVREEFRYSNRVSVFNISEFSSQHKKYDRAFCINVLSVIPFYNRRMAMLHEIKSKLKPGGSCLFVVQYRNSDFTRMSKMKNSMPWRDGYIVDSLRGYSFYGLISPKQLKKAISSAGFFISELSLNDGSAYILATAK